MALKCILEQGTCINEWVKCLYKVRDPKITHRIDQKLLLSSLPETDAHPRLLRRADVVAEDLDRVDEAELLSLELLHKECLGPNSTERNLALVVA